MRYWILSLMSVGSCANCFWFCNIIRCVLLVFARINKELNVYWKVWHTQRKEVISLDFCSSTNNAAPNEHGNAIFVKHLFLASAKENERQCHKPCNIELIFVFWLHIVVICNFFFLESYQSEICLIFFSVLISIPSPKYNNSNTKCIDIFRKSFPSLSHLFT